MYPILQFVPTYITKCKLDGLPVTLHHCKTITLNINARYVGDGVPPLSKCAYTRT